MNACRFVPSPAAASDMPGLELWKLVDFKWLMAGEGWWVDLGRFRRDEGYARQCLGSAHASRCEPLRRRAAGLVEALSRGEATATRLPPIGEASAWR